jgi:hypothetical protein
VSIWENKTFRRDPLLVKNDGPIIGLRRWFQQFYLNSPAQEEETREREEGGGGGRRSGGCGNNSICKHPEWLDW